MNISGQGVSVNQSTTFGLRPLFGIEQITRFKLFI
ncbi:MAG: hypothetical protein ACI8XG_002059 [Congregibacter sp.]|jgi:hypothetical protein